MIISLRLEMIVLIHHLVDDLLANREYIFEFDNIALTMYAHFIDAFINCVLVRNDREPSNSHTTKFPFRSSYEDELFSCLLRRRKDR